MKAVWRICGQCKAVEKSDSGRTWLATDSAAVWERKEAVTCPLSGDGRGEVLVRDGDHVPDGCLRLFEYAVAEGES